MLVSTLLLALALISGVLCNFTSPWLNEECRNLQQKLSEPDVTEKVFRNQRFSSWERPVLDANKSIEVTLDLFLRSIAEVDEKKQQIKVAGYLVMTWYDEVHVWNETTPINCIRDVVVPHGKTTGLWVPDVAFTRSTDKKYELTRSPLELVKLCSDGYAIYAPGSVFEFQCDFNLALFPFDSQIHQQHFARKPLLTFEEWHKTEHEEWRLMGGSAAYKSGQYVYGEYDWVEFEIRLQRKAAYYALTIILPCVLIAAVEIFTFAIPFDKSVRLEVSFTCLLAYSMFQSIVTSEMPHSADDPPLLLVLISLLTIYIGFAICSQSIVILLASKARYQGSELPTRLLRLADCLAAPVGLPRLLVIKAVSEEIDSVDSTEKAPMTPQLLVTNEEAWLYIARVADRYSCFLFILLLGMTSFGMLIVVPAAIYR